MNLTIPTMGLAIGIAVTAATISTRYYRRSKKPKLALARLDFYGYVLAYGGVLSLLPESIRLYAPELLSSFPNFGTVWERIDYLAFFFVSAAFGTGATKRYLTIGYERH